MTYMGSSGAANENTKEGRYAFQYGQVFDKGISMAQGQCPVKRYKPATA